MLRRIRSALVIAALWGVVWLPVGVALATIMRWIAFPLRSIDWISLGAWTGLGMASGATFAFLLARLERDRSIDTLAPSRLAAWGVLAGAGVPLVFTGGLLALIPDLHLAPGAFGTFALMGVTGIATALGTIAVARHGGAKASSAAPPT
jgi:hypothetical protein